MSLEKVREEVLSEAKGKADELKSQADAEVKAILKAARDEAAAREKQVESELAHESEQYVGQAVASAELSEQKKLLALRKGLIDQVFVSLVLKLNELPDETRIEHVETMLKKAQKEMKIARTYANSRDAKFITDFEVKEQDMLGGLIAESEDGSVRIDLRYEGLIETLKENIVGDLAGKLFT